ncbi:hypothetical protein SASPL_147328 [Salvia splendens]|uniref:EGF-like domain-containing protein n=1 Tax=Salvia splendens TaxID=180675 RepID=A0A8X8WDU5_SALSN|nr:latent-transforming growth factor beta-binding protein 2-like isoform X1 [Salvia splendens]KAG6393098.1 hypothetical protein SASPL_147328 [Salvia splendens]
MARAAFVAVIVILLYCQFATADTPPYNNINPIFDPCERVGVCGRGNCVHVTNNTLGFVCECESGWRQARLQEDAFFAFLPCVFPNCTLNYTCTDNNPPRSDDYDYQGRTNISYTDPCYTANCGGGRCNITSPFTRSCLCEDGFQNLLNSTTFPCYRQCAIGNECAGLGFSANTTVIDPFAPLSNNAARLMERVAFGCIFTVLIQAASNFYF